MDIEKNGVVSQIRAVEESSSENDKPLPHPSWTPGFLARFPWLGFGALFAVLMCAVGSIITLVLSNGKSQTHWPAMIAPNVIIGGLNNLANIMFGIAIGSGIAIAWWRQTLRGATIEELHRSWSFSSSFKDLVLSGKHFNFIALAALTTKLAIVDSILLQRATTTTIMQDKALNVTNINGFINDTIPITGTVVGRGAIPGLFANNTVMDVAIWQQSGGLFSNPLSNCNGLCNLYLPGAGFEITCNSSTQHIDYGNSTIDGLEVEAIWYQNNQTGPDPNATTYYDMFGVVFDVTYRTNDSGVYVSPDGIDYSTLTMNILYTQANDSADNDTGAICPGTLFQRTCTLRPAVINYPATIENYSGDHAQNGISLGFNASGNTLLIGTDGLIGTNDGSDGYSESNKQQEQYQVLSYNDVYEDHTFNLAGSYSRLAGLLAAFETYLSGNSTINFSGAAGFNIAQEGLAETMLSAWPSTSDLCGYRYEDPTDYLVQQINRLMFIYSIDPYGVDPANNFSETRNFTATMYRDNIHYQTEFRYMWGAVASMIVCILCVLPSYYGYWQLGRKDTLGPFEIANAFRSPVLESEASNGEVEELIKVVGERRVRYGEMTTELEAGRLAVAEPESVRRVHPSIGSARVEINEKLGHVLRRNVAS